MTCVSMGGEAEPGGEPGVPDLSARLRCAGCGEPIGVLEAAWLEDADGTLRPSSVLNLDSRARAGATRAWHPGCVRLPQDDG